MKKLLSILFIASLSFLLFGCTEPTRTYKDNLEEKTIKEQPKESITNKSHVKKINLNNYLGKPTLIIWAATWCPHCQNAIPKIESEIYEVYGNKINVLLNTIDDKSFNVSMPEVVGSNMSFEDINGTSCGYVPSWSILDKKTNVIMKNCGSEHSLDDAIARLDELLAD